MNVFTNDAYFKAQLDRAKKMRLFGLLALLVALSAALYFQFVADAPGLIIILSYPFLFVGFPLWTVGNNRLRALKQNTRVDQQITAELKGFNDKYSLHHFPTVNGRVIKHLLVAPPGLIVIESSEALGPVSCSGDRWKARTRMLDRLAGTNSPVGDPTAEVRAGADAVHGLLETLGKPDVPVKGLVVFARAKEIEVNECTYPAVPVNETRNAVRTLLADMQPDREERTSVKLFLTTEDRRKLNATIAPPRLPAPSKPTAAKTQAKNQ